jgi:hypothetical protein
LLRARIACAALVLLLLDRGGVERAQRDRELCAAGDVGFS